MLNNYSYEEIFTNKDIVVNEDFDTLVFFIKQKPVSFYTERYPVFLLSNAYTYCSLIDHASLSNNIKILQAIQEAFPQDINSETLVYSYVLDCLDTPLLKLYSERKQWALFNNINFLSENNLIKGLYIDDPVAKELISYAFSVNSLPILYSQFHQFTFFYKELFLTFLESTYTSPEKLKKGFEFYDTHLNEILSKINNYYLSDNTDFETKHYLKIINQNPSALTKVSANMESVRYLFSFIQDKEQYIKTLYKKGRNKSNFLLKEKGLYNSTSPILYAAFKGNAEFINYMIDQGYVLNNEEKNFIKQHNLEKQITSFEDDIYSQYNQILNEINSEDNKARYLFEEYKRSEILFSDLVKFLLQIDCTKIKNTYRPFIYKKMTYSSMLDLYLEDKASIVDCLIYSKDISFLKDLNISFNTLQKAYLSERLSKNLSDIIDVEFFSGKCQNHYDYFNYFIKKVNSDFIYNMYYKKINDIHHLSLIEDLFLTQHVSIEDLQKNKEIYTNQSLFMNVKCIENSIELNQNEISHICTIIKTIIPFISDYNMKRDMDRFTFDNLCESVVVINDKFNYFAADLYEKLKTTEENDSPFIIFLRKTVLRSITDTPLLTKKTQRI